MSVNLLETVQANLGYPPLQKIDPNTQAVADDQKTVTDNSFSQAAIPAVLTAFYRYTQSDEGAEEVLRGDNSTMWVDTIFHDNKEEVLHAVAAYAGEPAATITGKLEQIATETVSVTRQNLPAEATIKDVKLFFSNQRNTILLYLPAALQMGSLLDDDTLDDNTNKMEGPISSLMHSIGSAFSKPATEDEIKHP